MGRVPVVVSSEIILHNLNARSTERLRFALSYPNPEYVKLRRLGKMGEGVPTRFQCMGEAPDGSVRVPRGSFDVVRQVLAEDDLQPEVSDQRSVGDAIGPLPAVPTYSYQQTGVVRIAQKTQGAIVLPCGGGKTRLGVASIARIARTTIVLVHTGDLLDQWCVEVRDAFGFDAGVVDAGRKEMNKPIVVASIKSLLPMLEEDPSLGARFGYALLDECFPAGTLVDGGAIEEMCVGDIVHSFDPETGGRVDSRVVRVFRRVPSSLVRLTFSDGRTLVCTPNHRLWTRDGWASALDCFDREVMLEERADGDVSGLPAFARVDRVEVLEPGGDGRYGGVCPDGLVYNLEVEGTHAYFANGVAVSNCHHAPAKMIQAILRYLPAKYRLGLTATYDREDGHTQLVGWSLGPKLLVKTVQELIDGGFLMRPAIEEVKSNFEFPMDPADKKRLVKLDRALIADAARNKIIVDLASWNVQAGESVLVLSNRKGHCRHLGKLLAAAGTPPQVVLGSTAKKKRKSAIEAMRTGEESLIIATSLADEGLNIKRLSRIILAFPGRASGPTTQRLGRLMRLYEGKVPILYDVVDSAIPTLANRASARRRTYRALGLIE